MRGARRQATVTPSSLSGSADRNSPAGSRSRLRWRQCLNLRTPNLMTSTVWIMVLLAIGLLTNTVHTALLQDGLFGQCYSDEESEVLKPLVIDGPLDPIGQELLRLALRRLAAAELNWPHARAQCTLAYFKFSVVYGIPYDAQFCAVRNPNNVWALIQEVQTVLASESAARAELLHEALQRNGLGADAVVAAPGTDEVKEERDGAAEAPNDAFPALLVDENSAAEIDDTEESQLRPTAASNDNNNGSDIFDAAIGQLQAVEAKKEKRSTNSQIAMDLVDNRVAPLADVDDVYAIAPPDMLVDAGALTQSLDAADNDNAAAERRAAAWNAWLAAMLAADGGGNDVVDASLPQLSADEEKQLEDYVTDMLNNRRANPSALNDSQLEKLVAFINSVKVMLQQKAAQLQQQTAAESSAPEIEEVIPLTSQSNEKQLLLKKDTEKFNNADMGLSNTVHKIVKGGLQRVEGNRVYLKVNEHGAPLTERQLTRMVDYLDRRIAAPNDLLFDAFSYDAGQLSFRVSRVKFLPALQRLFENLSLDDLEGDEENQEGEKEQEKHAATGDGEANSDAAKKGDAVQLESASGVAQAVYKRRKDIETLADVEVDETGIGSGVDILPVGGVTTQRNWFFASATAVCAVALVIVASVLAMQLVRARRTSGDLKKSASRADLPEVIDYIEGKPSTIYEDLCRQRMSGQESVIVPMPGSSGTSSSNAPAGAISAASAHSSTSSWPDDTYLQSSNLDISTGHVILGFLRDCLEKPDEISNQWSQLATYQNAAGKKNVAEQPDNVDKNLDGAVLPYDDSVVMVSPSTQFRTQSRPSSNEQQQDSQSIVQTTAASGERKYVNASRIYDADPRQPVYIAAQAPLVNTVAEFWQAIWQEGIVVIVNLTDWADERAVRYWPREEEGSKVYDALEVNLVSEHSFNQDYVVRSIYLKNLNTNETRTVTQFHYVSWKEGGLPRSIESLLEFRRKMNKSYRSHSSPVLVHCTNGAGRTGAYILIDMVVNRILKGVKELNIAASLEHLRDQRMSLIDNEAQYKLIFRCVAEEVSVLLKNLQH